MPTLRTAHPIIGDPPRKALYLATSTPLRIDAEGESLLLRRSAQATARYPLARIDRIVCNRHADWSGNALALDEYKRVYVYNAQLDPVFPELARAWCYAFVVKQLAVAAIANTYWAYDGQPLNLADDLFGLLWAELNLEAASIAAAADQTRTQLLLVESWIARHPGRLPEHLARFRRHLAHENQQWP